MTDGGKKLLTTYSQLQKKTKNPWYHTTMPAHRMKNLGCQIKSVIQHMKRELWISGRAPALHKGGPKFNSMHPQSKGLCNK